jgi:hypothetical protein
MKKMILAAILMIATTATTFAGPVITIRVEIGRKSLGCDRFGICSTSVEASWRLSSMQNDEINNSLLINVSRELIVGKENYFSGSTVTFEEPFTLPLDVQRALGLQYQTTIEAGTYKLVLTKSGYQIVVPLN